MTNLFQKWKQRREFAKIEKDCLGAIEIIKKNNPNPVRCYDGYVRPEDLINQPNK